MKWLTDCPSKVAARSIRIFALLFSRRLIRSFFFVFNIYIHGSDPLLQMKFPLYCTHKRCLCQQGKPRLGNQENKGYNSPLSSSGLSSLLPWLKPSVLLPSSHLRPTTPRFSTQQTQGTQQTHHSPGFSPTA